MLPWPWGLGLPLALWWDGVVVVVGIAYGLLRLPYRPCNPLEGDVLMLQLQPDPHLDPEPIVLHDPRYLHKPEAAVEASLGRESVLVTHK